MSGRLLSSRRWLLALLLMTGIMLPMNRATSDPQPGHGYDFPGNGKRPGKPQETVWAPVGLSLHEVLAGLGNPDGKPLTKGTPQDDSVFVSASVLACAKRNIGVVRRYAASKGISAGNLDLSGDRLRTTADCLLALLKGNASASASASVASAASALRLFSWRGEDGQGNVHFTGYYSPLLQASRERRTGYPHPIYGLPENLAKPWPTRKAIESSGALSGKNLELAWTDDPLSLYFLHVQGSGWLAYPDGTREVIEYAGQNGHRYRSIGRMLVGQGAIAASRISLRAIREWFDAHPEQLFPLLWKNPSYTFFRRTPRPIRGAAGVDLEPLHAVAADRRFLPLGSCLLAEVPILDADGLVQGYEPRFMFVHDTGGAIREGHLDIYHGIGDAAGLTAGDLHHYGRVWLILAGPDESRSGPLGDRHPWRAGPK